MKKVEKCLQAEKVATRKQRDVEYQNRRKERLKELGEKKISVRLNSTDYEKLSDLCECLGYRRPKEKMHNLIENYSAVLTYLLRVDSNKQLYNPQSQTAKELYDLYKNIDHLKNDIGVSDDKIVEDYRKRNILTPLGIFLGNEDTNWKKKHIHQLLNEEVLLERLSILDENE